MILALITKIKLALTELKVVLNKDTIIFLISDTLFYCTSSVVGTFLGVYITARVAPGRLDAIGLVSMLYQIAFSLASLNSGFLARKFDMVGKKNMVAVAYLISGITTILVGFAQDVTSIAIIFTICGLAEGIASPIKWSIYSKIINKKYDDTAWGLDSFVTSAIPALALLPVGYLSEKYHISIIFILSGILTLVSGFFFGFVGTKVPFLKFKRKVNRKKALNMELDEAELK